MKNTISFKVNTIRKKLEIKDKIKNMVWSLNINIGDTKEDF